MKHRIRGIITGTEVCRKSIFYQCSGRYSWTSVCLSWIPFIISSRAYGSHLGSPRSPWFYVSAPTQKCDMVLRKKKVLQDPALVEDSLWYSRALFWMSSPQNMQCCFAKKKKKKLFWHLLWEPWTHRKAVVQLSNNSNYHQPFEGGNCLGDNWGCGKCHVFLLLSAA